MSLTVAPKVNIDTLKNLSADKLYFLSSTTGRVKEASLMMRFKCWIGVSSARQKVANLVEAMKNSLLDAAGQAGNKELETSIGRIDRTSMIQGSVIKNIANRFSSANAKSIASTNATSIIAQVAKRAAAQANTIHINMGGDTAMASVIGHALKPLAADPDDLPMTTNAAGEEVLDRAAFESQVRDAANDASKLLDEIARDERLGSPRIDKLYAKHIIATLYNADGTRNDKTVKDLKTPSQVRVDYAFKLNEKMTDNRPQEVHRRLLNAGIDPEKKLAAILKFCNGNKNLENYVMAIAPALCYNSNNDLRSDATIQKKIAAIKDALDEINSLQKKYPNTAHALKNAMAVLDATAFPPGMLTRMAASIEKQSFQKFTALNSLSTSAEMFEAIDELRKAMLTCSKEVNFEKSFMDAGEDEVGGPHTVAAKYAALALAIAKLGPGVAAKLPRILQSREFQVMAECVSGIATALTCQDPNIIEGDERQRKIVKDAIGDIQTILASIQDTINLGRDRPLEIESVGEVDINSESAVAMRMYLSNLEN